MIETNNNKIAWSGKLFKKLLPFSKLKDRYLLYYILSVFDVDILKGVYGNIPSVVAAGIS